MQFSVVGWAVAVLWRSKWVADLAVDLGMRSTLSIWGPSAIEDESKGGAVSVGHAGSWPIGMDVPARVAVLSRDLGWVLCCCGIDNGQAANEEDGGDEATAGDAWIWPIRISHKNKCLMILLPDLKMLIDAVVVADEERDGFPLSLLEKEVPELDCGLDRSDVVSSSPTCRMVWINRTARRWRCIRRRWERQRCRCLDVVDDRQWGSRTPLVDAVVLRGTDRSISGSPETLPDGSHAWLPMMVMEHHISVLRWCTEV
ncbi:hypothetical protein ACLOJK_034643 [Asimina triloba]